MSLSVNDALSVQFSTGSAGNGSKSVPGLRVGDLVLFLYDSTGNPGLATVSLFELVISVDGHIQQLGGGDLTAYTWQLVVLRPIAVS